MAGPRTSISSIELERREGRREERRERGRRIHPKAFPFAFTYLLLHPESTVSKCCSMILNAHFLQPVATPNSNGALVLFLSSYLLPFLPPALHSSQIRPLPRSCSASFLARSLASRDSSLTFSGDPLLGLPQRLPDFSLLLPASSLPAAGLSRGQGERPSRLSLLLGAALALPRRPPGGRLPREEDACTEQSLPMLVSTVFHHAPPPASPRHQQPLLLPNLD